MERVTRHGQREKKKRMRGVFLPFFIYISPAPRSIRKKKKGVYIMLCVCQHERFIIRRRRKKERKKDVIQRVEDNDEWLFRGLHPARDVLPNTLQAKKMQKDPGKYIFVENCSFHNSILAPFFICRKGSVDEKNVYIMIIWGLTKEMIDRCIE